MTEQTKYNPADIEHASRQVHPLPQLRSGKTRDRPAPFDPGANSVAYTALTRDR